MPQMKKAIPHSSLQETTPAGRNALSGRPSRVGLAILALTNLSIFAGIAYSIALGLTT